MIDVDDICMLYRRAHNDKNIINIIATVQGISYDVIRNILIERKLMTAEGKYNAPIRLTGREKIMAQWKWMPHRKKQFNQMKAEGKSLEQIAKALGCPSEIVTEYDNNPRPIRPHKKPTAPTPVPPEATTVAWPPDNKHAICALAEQILAMELLEYHNRNYLAGDNKSRSEVRQAMLREIVSLASH